MLCFKNAGIKYAVYEVGLGGRLDATNVITPLCSCISQIELEHTEYLGNTEELIAAEKGGIIKQEIPVIVSGQKESVKNVFRKIAKEKMHQLFLLMNAVKYLKLYTKIHSKIQQIVKMCTFLDKIQ